MSQAGLGIAIPVTEFPDVTVPRPQLVLQMGHWQTHVAKLAHELTNQQELWSEGAGKDCKGWEK